MVYCSHLSTKETTAGPNNPAQNDQHKATAIVTTIDGSTVNVNSWAATDLWRQGELPVRQGTTCNRDWPGTLIRIPDSSLSGVNKF